MALVVNHNNSATNALNNLNRTNRSLSATMGRISSGLRINKAADDGAGLGVAENLEAANRSLRIGRRNANDGIAVIQIAEAASNEVAGILKRMRELAVQSSSETLESTERQYVETEFTTLRSEIDRIADVTEFNGIHVARGTDSAGVTQLAVQVGMYNTTDDRIEVNFGNLDSNTGLGISGVSLSGVANAQTAIDTIDTALDSVNNYRSTYGATQNRLESAIRSLDTYSENLAAAESQIRDADFAHEAAEMARDQIMQQAGTAILSQATQINQGALRLIG
jgi:flagellin